MDEAPRVDGRPAGEGWWIARTDELAWSQVAGGGTWCVFEADGARSPTLGIGVHLLGPGESPGMYHREDQQEGFLVLAGRCTGSPAEAYAQRPPIVRAAPAWPPRA